MLELQNVVREVYANTFVLEEVDRIVRERWRIIERTTPYGWLTLHSRASTISRKDLGVLSALASKIGYENCEETVRRVRDACRDVHPNYVTRIAMLMLDEAYTVVMLKKRKRESKRQNTILRDLPPTVFTISRDIFFSSDTQHGTLN